MIIKENPFYKLNISTSDSRRKIIEKQEELEFFMDSDVVSESINTIITPSKRTSAELSWYIFANDETINSIRRCIDNNQTIPTGNLKSTDLINSILFNFEKASSFSPPDALAIISIIDEQYSYLNDESICCAINEKRQIAGMQNVTIGEIDSEIGKYKDTIRQVIGNALDRFGEDVYVELCTSVAEKYNSSIAKRDSIILRDIIDQYEIKMQSKVDELASEIIDEIKLIDQVSPSEIDVQVDSIIEKLKFWDKYAQPIQVKSMTDGTQHATSTNLADKLFGLIINLNNNKNRTDAAIKLNDVMKGVFLELTEMLDSMKIAGEKLENIAREQEESKKFEEEAEQHRWADKVYDVKLFSSQYIMPPFCACCLEPTTNKEKISCTSQKTVLNTRYTNTISVDVPLCTKCIEHRDAHKKKYFKVDLIAVCLSCVAIFLFMNLELGGFVAWILGAMVLAAAFFIVSAFIKLPQLDTNHASRSEFVEIIAPIDPFAKFGNPYAFGLRFKNWEFAQLFKRANGTNVVSYAEAYEKNNINAKTLYSAGYGWGSHLLGSIGISILAAIIICNLWGANTSSYSSGSSTSTTVSPTSSSSQSSGDDYMAPRISDNVGTKPATSTNNTQSTAQNNATPQVDKAEIEKQERWIERLDKQKAQIEDYEEQLTSLQDDITAAENAYYNTEDDAYIDLYNGLVEDYNAIYESYSSAIENYNSDVDAYNEYYGYN